LVGQLGGEAKVGDLDTAVGVEENVVGLDVTMDDALAVGMTEALAGLHVTLSVRHPHEPRTSVCEPTSNEMHEI
jgi:hypothetical protein